MTGKDLPDPAADDRDDRVADDTATDDAVTDHVGTDDVVAEDAVADGVIADEADTGPIASIDALLAAAAETPAPAPTVASTRARPSRSGVDARDRDAFELELDGESAGTGPLSGEPLADVPLYDHTADGDPLGPPVLPPAGSHRHREHAAAGADAGGHDANWRRAVPVALLAVGAIVVGIAVADLWPSSGPSTPATAAPAPQVTASSVALPGVLAGSATPAGGAASTGTVPASAAASPKPAAGTASVTVLNQTSVKDLGATEAGRITAAGWYVRRVTDVNARETVTTVFYDTGQEDQAEQLIKTVPTVHRAQPRPLWLLRTGGLIVVVADDAA